MDHRIEILARETGYDGFFRLERIRLRHRLFGGDMSPPIVREVVDKGDVAAVLPYDPVRDTVVLIEQFRIGALAAPGGAWLTEIVAGLIEPGETPEEVARREAREEAGCTLLDLEPVCRFLSSPSKSSELSWLYCGRTDSTGLGGVHGLAAEGEDIRVFTLPLETALTEIGGRINSPWPIIALQWLALNRDGLRQRWAGLPP